MLQIVGDTVSRRSQQSIPSVRCLVVAESEPRGAPEIRGGVRVVCDRPSRGGSRSCFRCNLPCLGSKAHASNFCAEHISYPS